MNKQEKQPEFAFGKKLGVSDIIYGNIPELTKIVARLLYCMKETNEKYGVQCEFFRLDFRQQYFDEAILQEFPDGAFVLDLKFGSKQELKKQEGN